MRYLLITILFFTSCLTPKRINKKLDIVCPLCPEKIITRDSIREVEKTVIKDSIVEKEIFVQLPADSSYIKAYLDCVEGKVVITKSTTKQGIKTTATASIQDNVLFVNCKTAQDSLKVMINEYHRLESNYLSVVKENSQSINLRPNNSCGLKWWQKVLIVIGIFAIIVSGIRFAFWLGRNFSNIKKGGLPFIFKNLKSLVKFF